MAVDCASVPESAVVLTCSGAPVSGITLSTLNNAKQGKNDFGKIGYGGPCPPKGSTHRYRFRLFALGAQPNLPSEASRSAFLNAIDAHVIAEGRLTGVFSR